jgi:tetratricopeptide (TPR) repeat protein
VARAFIAAAFLACILSAQKPPQPVTQAPEPPEEDESLAPKQYALNPVQAKKEATAGDYYFKKSNYSAAERRYVEATRWDPGSPDAFRKLGEAREKLHEYGPAREAYLKYIPRRARISAKRWPSGRMPRPRPRPRPKPPPGND